MFRSLGMSLVLVAALTACASRSQQPVAAVPQLPDGVVVKSLTTLDQIYVVRSPADRTAILCMAPFPDAIGSSSHDTTFSAGLTSKEGVARQRTRGGERLGGRSADVLLSRELLYRACELAANLHADQELTLKIYDRFLTTLESISKYQTGTGTAAESPAATTTASGDDDKGDDGKKD